MILSLLGLAAAVVVQDWTALRAAPDDNAPRQATLWRGDWVEVRGRRRDFLKVYHHRTERPGYLRVHRARCYRIGQADAPRLRAVVDFLRDTPGAESLGIGYVALYLRAASREKLDPEIFDALGTMAERLARRASRPANSRSQRFIAAHLDVARSYGVRFERFEVGATTGGEQTRTCYAGDAFRRVLASAAVTSSVAVGRDAVARAALALTDPRCVRPGSRPHEARARLRTQVALLAKIDPTRAAPYLGNRLRLRVALLSARLAYALARKGDRVGATRAARRAHRALLRVQRGELARSDQAVGHRAALQVSAVRWARSEPAGSSLKGGGPITPSCSALRSGVAGAPCRAPRRGPGGPWLELSPGRPGETCVRLVAGPGAKRRAERCTYGLVWPSSIRRSPRHRQLTVAVQQLPGWLVVWVFRRAGGGWIVDTLAPSSDGTPELGYVEVAGWTPGGRRLLLAREALVDGRHERRFESLVARSLEVRVSTGSLRRFRRFRRWHAPDWKQGTLALR